MANNAFSSLLRLGETKFTEQRMSTVEVDTLATDVKETHEDGLTVMQRYAQALRIGLEGL